MRPRIPLLCCLAFDAWVLAHGPRMTACIPVDPGPEPATPVHPDRIAFHDSLARLHTATYDSLVADAIPRMAAVELEDLTLVAFYPEPHLLVWPWADVSLEPLANAFRLRLERYRSLAATFGFAFVERYNRGVLLADRPRGDWYRVDLLGNQVGFVLAAPGLPPLVLAGTLPPDAVVDALRAYGGTLSQKDRRPGRLQRAASQYETFTARKLAPGAVTASKGEKSGTSAPLGVSVERSCCHTR